MLYLKDHICVGEKAYCEDAVGWGDRFLFAMDGASGLSGTRLMDADSDAEWFVKGVQKGLCRTLDNGDERSTEEILLEITDALWAEYKARAAELGVGLPPDTPSAGLALFREVGDEIEFLGLGDCVGVAELTDGTLYTSCDEALQKLDGIVIERMAEIHRETGGSVLEARKQCNEMLLEHRLLRNTSGGYWILDPSGAGVHHACVRRWKKSQVRRISAFSDGLAQLADTFERYEDYGALHREIIKTSLQVLVDQLFAAQEADAEANLHPRLKFRDDTCGVLAEVIP